ncbi:hypothetical protein B0H66DRAFT_109191 [Apodospora peruviana]|uniref:Uncharacterized protein n=1 Tax=Apodospora peruviana TaxID=516989 RepID=A0AAE0IH92_9PEZI|nr:hypothetical protein B0H66DRAFT_109191 [Apodospora peruviana]
MPDSFKITTESRPKSQQSSSSPFFATPNNKSTKYETHSTAPDVASVATSTKSPGRTTPKVSRCPARDCPKDLRHNFNHCFVCGRHHPGQICYWCQPNLAPRTWPHRTEALRRKEMAYQKLLEKRAASTRQSTGFGKWGPGTYLT